jgi:hypothetical protein
MFMKVQQVSVKTGVLTETANSTNQALCDRTGGPMRKIPKVQDEPTMFMKAQQVSAIADTLTEFQVTQNKQLKDGTSRRSAK